MFNQTRSRLLSLILLLLIIPTLLIGCGSKKSPYYVEIPKGEPSLSYLTDEQLKCVDAFLRDFTAWFNTIDPSESYEYTKFYEDFKQHTNDSYSRLINSANYSDSQYAIDSIKVAAGPGALTANMLAKIPDSNDVEYDLQSDAAYFNIPINEWEDIHDTLVNALNIFY